MPSLNPELSSDYDITSNNTNDPRIVILFPGDMIAQFSGIIVETWDHVVPVYSRSESKNRAYKREFTEKERAIISRYHTKMYRWCLVTGHPQEIGMTMATYHLLHRAANFFVMI